MGGLFLWHRKLLRELSNFLAGKSGRTESGGAALFITNLLYNFYNGTCANCTAAFADSKA